VGVLPGKLVLVLSEGFEAGIRLNPEDDRLWGEVVEEQVGVFVVGGHEGLDAPKWNLFLDFFAALAKAFGGEGVRVGDFPHGLQRFCDTLVVHEDFAGRDDGGGFDGVLGFLRIGVESSHGFNFVVEALDADGGIVCRRKNIDDAATHCKSPRQIDFTFFGVAPCLQAMPKPCGGQILPSAHSHGGRQELVFWHAAPGKGLKGAQGDEGLA